MSALLLLRHAQSTWNADGRWQGHADPPLSPEGERQADQAASRLAGGPGFDLVVASDLTRARRTAERLAAAVGAAGPLTILPGLREYDVGEWSGLTRDQIEARWPGAIARFATGGLAAPPGGEDRAAFDARVLEAARQAGEIAAQAGAGRVLVVVHGGVLRALARAAGRPEYRAGHLAGYRGYHDRAGLFPSEPVDLLDGSVIDPDPAGAAGRCP